MGTETRTPTDRIWDSLDMKINKRVTSETPCIKEYEEIS